VLGALFLTQGMVAQWIIDNNNLPACDRSNGMRRIGWNNPYITRDQALSEAVDRYFQFAFNHLINFFLRMGMLMNRRTCVKFIVRECHARRIEIAASPAWQAFDRGKFARINAGHFHPQLLRPDFKSKRRVTILAGIGSSHYWDACEKDLQSRQIWLIIK